MLFTFNKTTLKNVIYNGVSLGKVIFNDVTVWIKESTQTGIYFHFYRCGDADGGDGTISITFDTPFASTPTVTWTLENQKYCTYSLNSVSNTGFQIKWAQTTGNSKYIEKCYIHWTAVGDA